MWRAGRDGLAIGMLAATIVGAVQACAPGAFACLSNDECVDGSASGTCESTGFCSFPDVACPSMRRYGELAGDGLAGECVDEEGTTTDDTNATTSTSTSTSASTSASTSTSTSTSTSMSATTTSTTEDSSSGPDPIETDGPDDPYGPCQVTTDCSDPTAVCVTNGNNRMCAPTCTIEGTPSSECPPIDGDPNGVGCLFTDTEQTITRCFAVCDTTVDCPSGMVCVTPVCTWEGE